MTKFISLLALMLASSLQQTITASFPISSGPVTIVFTRAGTLASGTTSPRSSSFSSNTAGCLIVAAVEANIASLTPVTVTLTDTVGNTYLTDSRLGPWVLPSTSGFQQLQLFYVPNCPASAGTNTVTATTSGTITFMATVVAEYSGAGVSAAPDSAGNAGSALTGSAMSSGSFSITSGDLVVGWGAQGSSSTAAGSGFTNRTPGISFFIYEDGIVAASSATATATASSSGAWTLMGAAFR